MKERTVQATLGGRRLEFYAGNMAVIRFKRAGGSMDSLGLLDRVKADIVASADAEAGAAGEESVIPLSHDEMVEASETALEFLHANLLPAVSMSFEELANLTASMPDAIPVYFQISRSIPWFGGEPGESSGETATGSSTTGATPSRSSDGIPIDSGSSAGRSGI